MIDIKIDINDFDYLVKSNLSDDIKSVLYKNHIKEFNTIFLTLEKVSADSILDFLSDELCRVGLEQNDEPNKTGVMIENIIDKFSRAVY